jgi:hypothetical protein
VTSDAPELLAQLRACFEAHDADREHDLAVHLSRDARDGSRGIRVATEPQGLLAAAYPELADFVRALVQWSVDQSARHYVFHAGAVEHVGRGVLLPGGSRAGKSTLVAALAARGFGVLSDEVGALDLGDQSLVGFPRALCLRDDTLTVLGLSDSSGQRLPGDSSRMVAVRSLGGVRKSAAPLALVVVAAYQREGDPVLRKLRVGEATVALMESACSQRRFKVRGLDFVIGLARRVPTYRLRYSRLDEAVRSIQELLADPLRAANGASSALR